MDFRARVRLTAGSIASIWICSSLGLGACGVRDVTLDPHALDGVAGVLGQTSGDGGRTNRATPTTAKTLSAGQAGGGGGLAAGASASNVAGRSSSSEGGTQGNAGGSVGQVGSADSGGWGTMGGEYSVGTLLGGANSTVGGAMAGVGSEAFLHGGTNSTVSGAMAGMGSEAFLHGGTNSTVGGAMAGMGSEAFLHGGTNAAGRGAASGNAGRQASAGSAEAPNSTSGAAGTAGATLVGPAIQGIPSGVYSTSESGSSVIFTFNLSMKPMANVSLGFASTDPTEGQVSPEWLTFTPSNWVTPQTVRVTGISDLILDGDIEYHVVISVASADSAYAAISPTPIVLVNLDSGAVFHGLGDLAGGVTDSGALDVSGDGNVVVGYGTGESGSQAVRWTPDEGLVPLVNGAPGGRAEGVSPDGGMIVGSVADSTWPERSAAVIWRHGAPGERFQALPADGRTEMYSFGFAYAVTDSGIAVGSANQYRVSGTPLGYRWEGISGTQLQMSIAYAVSADGLISAGVRYPAPRTSTPIVAISGGSGLGYPVDATCVTPQLGDCTSLARGISADGSVVVGETKAPPPYASTGAIYTGFVWTASEKMLRLPDLPFGVDDGAAYDINNGAIAGGGSIIVGYGTDDTGRRAMVWLNRIPRAIEPILGGGIVPAGWKLGIARAVSANGRVVVGQGTNPAGQSEAWRAILPAYALK